MTFTAAKLSTYLFQIAAIENSGGSSHGTASGSDAKVQQLQQKCDLLQKKLDAAQDRLNGVVAIQSDVSDPEDIKSLYQNIKKIIQN